MPSSAARTRIFQGLSQTSIALSVLNLLLITVHADALWFLIVGFAFGCVVGWWLAHERVLALIDQRSGR